MFRTLATIACLACLPATATALEKRLRRPVAIALSPNSSTAFVLNQRSGTLSVIDVLRKRVVKEIAIGGKLSSLALSDDGKRLFVTDEQNHKLIVLQRNEIGWKIGNRIAVAKHPVGVAVDRKNRRVFVSSLWSRTVTVVDLEKRRVAAKVPLAFAPRRLCCDSAHGRLYVAASFSGRLAVIDTRKFRVIADHKLPGHNIRGLSLSADGKRLLTAQQTLNSLAKSTLDDVHWGNMFSNLLYSFDLKLVNNPKADLLNKWQVTHLGRPGNAAGDPGAIAVHPQRVAVVLSGMGETLVAGNLQQPLSRVKVGKRPAAVAISSDGRTIFVANTFSDSVTIIDAEKKNATATISLGPMPKLSVVDRGEELFFDARLSHDGWMSCHSCHTDGHSNGRLNDNLSDGTFGTPKRVLSLLGVGKTRPWAWNGKVKSLGEQVRNSVTKTMRGKDIADRDVAALVKYMESLSPPPPAVVAAPDSSPKPQVARGKTLFQKLDCVRCHTPPTYTSEGVFDVGFKDEQGTRRFNPPSLLGVGRRDTLFHDGRAKSLEAVLKRYQHQLKKPLSKQERDDLLEFLRTL